MTIAKNKNIPTISTVDFIQLEKSPQDILLDVRTIEEWNEGHVEGAIHIDYLSPTFSNAIEKLDKSKTYYVYCKSGKRSAGAIAILNQYGFKHCINLIEGIIGFNNLQYPLISQKER